MIEPKLTSFSILKVNLDKNKDYIDYFVPFVAESLRSTEQKEISLPDLQEKIRELFGLSIPRGALSTILNRTVKEGYVRRENRIYIKNDDLLNASDFMKQRNRVLREQNELIEKLLTFVRDNYKVKWAESDAEDALTTYLQHDSIPILISSFKGSTIPKIPKKIDSSDYILNTFICHLEERDQIGFKYLEDFVKANMLANVLYYYDLGSIKKNFEKVEVYFDTKFILRALGFSGNSLREPCRELIDLLYTQNASLRCFEHTLDEVIGVLFAIANSVGSPERLRHVHGETMEHMIRADYSRSDILIIIERIRSELGSLHIQVRPRPPHSIPLGLDEGRIRSILKEHVGYKKEETLLHDLDALTAIHRLRKGKASENIETCEAIFVTTNRSLAKASYRFFAEDSRIEGSEERPTYVSHCMFDYILTTLVWIKDPLKAPGLPRKRILADCYTALNPNDDLWLRYLDEIDKQQKNDKLSETDYSILRYTIQARTALMDLTYGDPSVFSEGTVKEILEIAKETIISEEKKRTSAAEEKVKLLEQQKLAQLKHFEKIGIFAGKTAYNILLWGGIIINLLCIILSIFFILHKPDFKIYAVLLGLFLIFTLVTNLMTIYNLSFGQTLQSIARNFEIKIRNYVRDILVRITTPREDLSDTSNT